jgi:hypothetical protein
MAAVPSAAITTVTAERRRLRRVFSAANFSHGQRLGANW